MHPLRFAHSRQDRPAYPRGGADQLLVSSLMLASPGSALDEATIVGKVLALARGGIQLIGLDHGGRP